MPPERARESFSLGVTQLLDELLARQEADDATRGAEPAAAVDEDSLAHAFQRTATLCGGLEQHLAREGQEGRDRAEAVRREIKAEQGLGFKDTLGSTGGSLAAALQANELRLQRIRAELEELKTRCESVLPAEEVIGDTCTSLAGLADLAGLVNLDDLLAECDAIHARTTEWRGLQSTPPGWRRLEPGELQAGAEAAAA